MIVDFAGREIKPGDSVVYPVRRGSSLELKQMQVTQIVEGESPALHGFNNQSRRIILTNLQNVVVI